MVERFPFAFELPDAAAPALAIVRVLRASGHAALLAGGCVRDLLLGRAPTDYDVATDTPPQQICKLFRPTRLVGQAFGVVLVKRDQRWIEVATFRSDGRYSDGRRPDSVQFTDAEHDAQRRDFTVNGMFLDPDGPTVIDYVAGRADLAARRIRCIGDPAARFGEDYLRLLRAVRFAARLDFSIENGTLDAMRTRAASLARIAAERIRDELEKMFAHPARRRAFALLVESRLLPWIWPHKPADRSESAAWDDWPPPRLERIDRLLAAMPADAPFETCLAAILADRFAAEVHEACRALACSNEQREATVFTVERQSHLDDPTEISLAGLKRLLAAPAFPALLALAHARFACRPDGAERTISLAQRIAAIPPDAIAPPPLITGDDLAARGVPAGPIYKRLLDELYTRQLNEELRTRADAILALESRRRASPPG
ncbi:MAG: CCA tRNA nucleotidyltransferase [Planctomycetes bacterium]|nr:CCA tRNA nucleotidyltransferase [Planctomycetota bacterium]